MHLNEHWKKNEGRLTSFWTDVRLTSRSN